MWLLQRLAVSPGCLVEHNVPSRLILLIPLRSQSNSLNPPPPSGSQTMGCAPSKNVDLSTEVTLYHFDLHRVVGKGAFGKVRHPS
jgi:hypothetical protein